MAKFDVAQFSARSDNFGVLLHDPQSGATAAINAPDADAIIGAAGAWLAASHISSPTSTSTTSKASPR